MFFFLFFGSFSLNCMMFPLLLHFLKYSDWPVWHQQSCQVWTQIPFLHHSDPRFKLQLGDCGSMGRIVMLQLASIPDSSPAIFGWGSGHGTSTHCCPMICLTVEWMWMHLWLDQKEYVSNVKEFVWQRKVQV